MRFRFRFPVSVGSRWGKSKFPALKTLCRRGIYLVVFADGCTWEVPASGGACPQRHSSLQQSKQRKRLGKDTGVQRNRCLLQILIGGVRFDLFTAVLVQLYVPQSECQGSFSVPGRWLCMHTAKLYINTFFLPDRHSYFSSDKIFQF